MLENFITECLVEIIKRIIIKKCWVMFFLFFFFSYAEIAIYNLGFHWKSFQILPITAFANKTSYNGKLLNSL